MVHRSAGLHRTHRSGAGQWGGAAAPSRFPSAALSDASDSERVISDPGRLPPFLAGPSGKTAEDARTLNSRFRVYSVPLICARPLRSHFLSVARVRIVLSSVRIHSLEGTEDRGNPEAVAAETRPYIGLFETPAARLFRSRCAASPGDNSL